MEIITGIERRRRWSLKEKRRLVAECDMPDSSVTRVSRQYDISRALLWSWRRQFRRDECGDTKSAPEFLPVTMMHSRSVPVDQASLDIQFSDGTRLCISRDVDAALIERVIGILRR